jgi:chromosome segregation ATPase
LQELEAALEHASNVAFEYQKNANKYQEAIRQSSMHLDEEQKTKAIARETLANADRRAHTLQNALEESRTMLEQADRARRAGEQELQVHCTYLDTVQDFLIKLGIKPRMHL